MGGGGLVGGVQKIPCHVHGLNPDCLNPLSGCVGVYSENLILKYDNFLRDIVGPECRFVDPTDKYT